MLLETAAPFLTPHPHRGQRNEPAYIPLIAQSMAELLDLDVAVVAEKTTALARRVFKVLS
jgi:TatD DNase family protein